MVQNTQNQNIYLSFGKFTSGMFLHENLQFTMSKIKFIYFLNVQLSTDHHSKCKPSSCYWCFLYDDWVDLIVFFLCRLVKNTLLILWNPLFQVLWTWCSWQYDQPLSYLMKGWFYFSLHILLSVSLNFSHEVPVKILKKKNKAHVVKQRGTISSIGNAGQLFVYKTYQT